MKRLIHKCSILMLLIFTMGNTHVFEQFEVYNVTDPEILAKRVTKEINFTNGDKANYYGEVNSSGVPHGWGKIDYSTGDIYEGDWVNGLREGSGRELMANGDMYIGQFKDNRRNGKGVFSNGDTYDGEWEDGYLMGQGV